MQRSAICAVVFVVTLSAWPAAAAPNQQLSSIRAPVTRFLVWLHSRLGPPIPEPQPSEASTKAGTQRKCCQ